jgi:microsomal prostaglandin-E synthase 2
MLFYVCSRHNLKDDVRQSLYDECNFWVKQLKKQNTKYLGGSSPNLADLAVFGVLNSIEGCNAFKDLLQNTRIGPWYYDMKVAVEKHLGNNLLGAK